MEESGTANISMIGNQVESGIINDIGYKRGKLD